MGKSGALKYDLLSNANIDNPLLMVLAFDERMKLRLWNSRAEEITGYTAEEAVEKGLPLFFHKYIPKEHDPYEKLDVQDLALKSRDGKIRNVRFYPQVIHDRSGQKAFLFMGADVTEQELLKTSLREKDQHLKRMSDRLKKFVSSDSHTGVLNYRYFVGALNKAFYNAFENDSSLSLILINLDYFHSVNTAHGISEGNRFLRETARLIKGHTGDKALVGRFTGTQFAVVLPDTDLKSAFKKAQKLYTVLTDHDFLSADMNHPVSLSMHMAVGGFPHCEDVCTPEQLLNRVADDLRSIRKKGNHSPIIMCASSLSAREAAFSKKTRKKELREQSYRYTVEFVNALANTIKTKDHYTKEHSRAMSNYAVYIAERLGLSEKDVLNVKYGAVLHDIGKIGIDRMILLKRGPLTPEEFSLVKQHPRIGAEIIRNVHPLKEVVPLILHHHERYDGTGYLDGLKGDQIPLGARIISIADVFQALTSDRPYRRALADDEAFEIIREYTGSYFDPKVVEAFFEVYHTAN